VEEVGPSESVSEDQKGGLSGRFGDFSTLCALRTGLIRASLTILGCRMVKSY
jgi:hypothetical protein